MKSHVNKLILLIIIIVLTSKNEAKILSSHQLRNVNATDLFSQSETIEDSLMGINPLPWNFTVNEQDFENVKILPTSPQVCDSNLIYIVEKLEDLNKDSIPILECIFRQGSTPAQIQLGQYPGVAIELTSTTQFNDIGQFFWKGKMVQKTVCNGQPSFIGWNNIRNYPLVPFIPRVGPFTGALHSSELNDGRDSVILDYTVNFPKASRELRSIPQNPYPINQIIDVLRIVGNTRDGGVIYLGKALFRIHKNSPAFRIAWFALVNYELQLGP